MIQQLSLSNFKSIGRQTYSFTDFDLLVGRNNSGKSTVLQALAIWQFCVDEFHRTKRSGSTGIQIVLPNFTALPVPEFNLLWKNRTDREWPADSEGVKKQKFILIEISLSWKDSAGSIQSFGIELRYHSPQAIYAIPSGGWAAFRDCERNGELPRIAYVPPFSGLEPVEKRLDDGPTRQQVGKGQPGSVLRNLLLRVCPPPERDAAGKIIKGYKIPDDWHELSSVVKRWFSVELLPPQYDAAKDVHIVLEYRQEGKTYDLISGGSGFHQTMTLLAFLYGYQPTTILLDEPDAHLHVNLQREILDYFKKKSAQKRVQFLIATHAEEFARGVDAHQILSLLQQVPRRIQSTPDVIRAMAEVSNEEITRLMGSPFMVYVEGESDERLLRAWSSACDAELIMDKLTFKIMGGGNKPAMREAADKHFAALRQIIPTAKRLMLFDFDDAETAFHPNADNPSLWEWRRRNIENYLLVMPVWRRALAEVLQCKQDDLFAQSALQNIDGFFVNENLTLPLGKTWRTVSANVFSVVNGKRILFENDKSLFHMLRNGEPPVELVRERVAFSMTADEIHEDVHGFFNKLKVIVGDSIQLSD
jgi:AAA domain, putative AbiEii toxin, Type IV TA system/AAA ATPase domain